MFLFDNKSNIYLKSNQIEFQSYYSTDFFDFFNFRNDADLDVAKLSDGDFEGYISRFTTDQIILELSQRNSLIKFNAVIPNYWLFAIPIKVSEAFYKNTYNVKENYIVVAPPKAEFSGIQHPFSNRFQLYVKEEFLDQVCQTLHLPEIRQLHKNNYSAISVLDCLPEKSASLCHSCTQLFQIGFDLNFQDSNFKKISSGLRSIQEKIEENILETLLLILAEAKDIKPKKKIKKRLSVLKKAEEMMNSSLKYDLKVNNIYQELGVSKRTLEYIFKDFYQITPKAYLKQLRLNGLHHALQHKSNEVTSHELAQEFGFFHRGQLSKDYRKLFGELPSETVKKYQADRSTAKDSGA